MNDPGSVQNAHLAFAAVDHEYRRLQVLAFRESLAPWQIIAKNAKWPDVGFDPLKPY